MARSATTLITLAALSCAGCEGWQSALNPHALQAARLAQWTWLLVGVCTLIWASVVTVLLVALRRQRHLRGTEWRSPEAGTEERLKRNVTWAVIATACTVAALTIGSFYATHSLASDAAKPLKVRVRGYQWWWEVTYLDSSPDQVFSTANEIHVPLGRTVELQLAAADVIHSLWVPSLTGKQDLIPGRDNTLRFKPTQVGVYRGQCAEFCGLQHAHMALLVIVDEPARFEQWRRGQVAPAASPRNSEQQTGKQVFESKACASCHNIQGSTAAATLGPDLTHVASRRYIAAGLLETNRGSLAAWIADPQTLKPGNNMPRVPLDATELNAVSAYLAALQ